MKKLTIKDKKVRTGFLFTLVFFALYFWSKNNNKTRSALVGSDYLPLDVNYLPSIDTNALRGPAGAAGAAGQNGLNAIVTKAVDSGVTIATPTMAEDTVLICTNAAAKVFNLTALPVDKTLEIINASTTKISVTLPSIPLGFNSAAFEVRGQMQSLTIQPNQQEFKNSCKIINTASGYVVIF